jgi:potassium-transporting ATPase ATP-binding subunit
LAALASAADDTPEGKSIKSKARELVSSDNSELDRADNTEFLPFKAQKRMSGINLADGRKIRKGHAAL